MNKISKIIIHHSLTKDSGTVSWGAIRKYHIETLKFKDVGYHYGIEKVGPEYKIFKGREENEIGAHTKGQNSSSIGICLVNNFDIQEPPKEQLYKLIELINDIYSRYGKLPIYPHNKFASWKSCPGTKFDMEWITNNLNSKGTEFIKAINKLNDKNIVNSPDYWLDNSEYKGDYVKQLIKNMAKYIENENIAKPTSEPIPKSKRYIIGNTKIIETTPDNLYIDELNNTLKGANKHGINGTFFWKGNPNGIAINGDKTIGHNASHAWRNHPQSVLCYYKDGTMGMERVLSANEILKPVHWAIGGIGLVGIEYNPTYEGFGKEVYNGKKYDYSDVLRTTDHTTIGYKKLYDGSYKVYLFIKPNCSRERTRQSAINLKLDGAIGLDSGGSTQMNYPNMKFDSNRKINTAVLLKEI